MSELPTLGRRGFRDWFEALSDLRAIESAPAPLNQARIWMHNPGVAPVAATGPFGVEKAGDDVALTVDGTAVTRLEASAFRGGWLRCSGDRYYLDLDVGRHEPIQVSGERAQRPPTTG